MKYLLHVTLALTLSMPAVFSQSQITLQHAPETYESTKEHPTAELRLALAETANHLSYLLDIISNFVTYSDFSAKEDLNTEIALCEEMLNKIKQKNFDELSTQELDQILAFYESLVAHLQAYLTTNFQPVKSFCPTGYEVKNTPYSAIPSDLLRRHDILLDILSDVVEDVKAYDLTTLNKAFLTAEKYAHAYHVDTIVKRGWPYAAWYVYMIRQKKEDDIAKSNCPFKKQLKKLLTKFVGSPKEKAPAVIAHSSDIANHEGAGFKALAKEHGYKAMEEGNAQGGAPLRTLGIELDASAPFKISVASWFTHRIYQDLKDLQTVLAQQWNKVYHCLRGDQKKA